MALSDKQKYEIQEGRKQYEAGQKAFKAAMQKLEEYTTPNPRVPAWKRLIAKFNKSK